MIDFAHYDNLVHRIYDAALEPQRWPEVLGEVADACNATRGVLLTPLHSPAQGGFFMPFNVPGHISERWAIKRIAEDPYAQVLVSQGLFRAGAVFDGRDLVPHTVVVETPFYRDLLEPLDAGRLCIAIVFDAADAHALPTVLTISRRERDAPFEAMQMKLLQRLAAHISRALGVMFHLRDGQFQLACSHVALNRLAAGVVLLDGQGSVQFCNTAARQQLKTNQSVALRAGTVGSCERLMLVSNLNHQLSTAFQRLLSQAVSPLAVAPEHFSNALLLPDSEGRPSCVLHASPLGSASVLAVGKIAPKAIVFMYDLAAVGKLPPGVLCELLDLTPAEARAALQILQGGSADTMARRLGVSINTFKSQLKAAYAKSGTHRQADFLKLLLALTATTG